MDKHCNGQGHFILLSYAGMTSEISHGPFVETREESGGFTERFYLSHGSSGLSHNNQFPFSGKAFGGRKTREKRLLVKHLTSADYSTGFHGDLNLARSKILTDNEWFGDQNKGKRKVIREQTKQTKTSLKDSIRSAKVKENTIN